MAQRNLRAAADAVTRHPRHAAELDADFEEAAAWRDAARDMVVPWDDDLGVHPQSEGFTSHDVWDFEAHAARPVPAAPALPVLRPLPQAGRQAGRPRARAARARRRVHATRRRRATSSTTSALTVRDSSLSACTQAVIAAEVGTPRARVRLLRARRRSWTCATSSTTRATACTSRRSPARGSAAVAGFGGMRDHDGKLTFAPRLPARLTRLAFRLVFRGRQLKRRRHEARTPRTRSSTGEPSGSRHHGKAIT